ncbi:CdaR family protein [Lacticaseibacillus mingshuiensis]|uniref:YbbR-like domain-containing protein n=1 Tax=Lacticaseibacillus mingshuiensis TaxID=2799574 RepID=A0ABW4CIR8_9LACO|nr:CdaR family protein [Lacticaseibacillus mingshuiensis]
MHFDKLWESKWFYRILALLLAIGLFAYVNAENLNNTRQNRTNNTAITATTTRTLKVPLQLNANTDKYFITGYPDKVSVTLSGSASLVTVTANTMNFRVIAELGGLGVGTHTVKLKEDGLNKDLTYSIKPETVKIKIQDRKSLQLPIQVKYNKDSLAPDYEAGTPSLSTVTAEATGGKGEIDRIYQVVANIVMARNTKADVSQQVLLQALDEKGNTVNVVLSPETVTVKLPVSLPSKKVPVTLKQTGTANDSLVYALTTSTKNVTVYGANAVLNKIDSLEVPVDVSGITENTTKTLDLSGVDTKLNKVSPASLKVTISVAKSAASSSSSSSADRASSSSSSDND